VEEAAMGLTDEEAGCLATLLLSRLISDGEWLEWENVPNLAEHAFERLCQAAEALAVVMFERSNMLDERMGIDSALLFEQATR
jgi:hypothetical protein